MAFGSLAVIKRKARRVLVTIHDQVTGSAIKGPLLHRHRRSYVATLTAGLVAQAESIGINHLPSGLFCGPLQFAQERVQGKVAYLAPMPRLQSIRIERLKHQHVLPLAQRAGQFPLEIGPAVGYIPMMARHLQFRPSTAA